MQILFMFSKFSVILWISWFNIRYLVLILVFSVYLSDQRKSLQVLVSDLISEFLSVLLEDICVSESKW